MGIRSTHSYSTLEVSPFTISDIERCLKEAGPEYLQRYISVEDGRKVVHWGGEIGLIADPAAAAVALIGLTEENARLRAALEFELSALRHLRDRQTHHSKISEGVCHVSEKDLLKGISLLELALRGGPDGQA